MVMIASKEEGGEVVKMRVVGARRPCMPVTGWSEWNYCRNMQAAQIKQGRLEDALRQHCTLLGHEVEAVKLLGWGTAALHQDTRTRQNEDSKEKN